MRAFASDHRWRSRTRRAARLPRSLRLTNRRGQHLDLQCLVWSNRASEIALAAGICHATARHPPGTYRRSPLIDWTLQGGFEGRPGCEPWLSVDKKTDGGCDFEDRGPAMG